MTRPTIIVCDGDQTGQELLEESLRVFDPSVLGTEVELVRFDLSLGARERSDNGVVHEAAAAMRETGLGLKAATVTPPERGERRVAEPHSARGHRRKGHRAHRAAHTGGHADRGALATRSSSFAWPSATRTGHARDATASRARAREEAWRTERIERSVCQSVAEFSFRTAHAMGGLVYGGPKWTVSATYEGMLKEEMDAAAATPPRRPLPADADRRGLRRSDDRGLAQPGRHSGAQSRRRLSQ